MTDSPVRAETHAGHVRVITLDRPKANAVDVPTSRALYAEFARLEDDAEIRVGVLPGAGDRFFSAGWDLNAAAAGEEVTADHGPGGFAGLTEYFDRRKPVIAAVNGLAFGGGFELALAADLVVAAEGAEFALPEASLGLLPDSGGVLRLPKRLPHAIAMELLLTGRRMAAPEAAHWGLVNRVVPAADLRQTALALAEQIAANAPLATAAIRPITEATAELDVAAGYAALRTGRVPAYDAVLASADAEEGPRAFAEKRAPIWTGG